MINTTLDTFLGEMIGFETKAEFCSRIKNVILSKNCKILDLHVHLFTHSHACERKSHVNPKMYKKRFLELQNARNAT